MYVRELVARSILCIVSSTVSKSQNPKLLSAGYIPIIDTNLLSLMMIVPLVSQTDIWKSGASVCLQPLRPDATVSFQKSYSDMETAGSDDMREANEW